MAYTYTAVQDFFPPTENVIQDEPDPGNLSRMSLAPWHVVARLTATLYVIVYIDSFSLDVFVRAVSISGTSITIGDEQMILDNTSDNVAQEIVAVGIDSTRFLLAYKEQTSDDGVVWAGSVSGTTVTMGAASAIFHDISATGVNTDWNGIQMCTLSSSKVLVAFVPDQADSAFAIDQGYYLTTVNISSTSISSVGSNTHVQTGTQIHWIDIATLDSSRAICIEGRRQGTSTIDADVYGVVISISGDTPSLNTAVQMPWTGDAVRYAQIGSISSSQWVVGYITSFWNGANDDGEVKGVVGSAVSTTVSWDSEYSFVTVNKTVGNACEFMAVGVGSATTFCFTWIGGTTADPVLQSSIINNNGGTLSLNSTLPLTEVDNVDDSSSPSGVYMVAAAKFLIHGVHSDVSQDPGFFTLLADFSGNVKVLGAEVSSGTGAFLYVTAWQSNELALKVYEWPAGNLLRSVSLGACTESELDALTYTAWPEPVYGNDNGCFVHGRFQPAGLGTCHVIYTTDAGLTLTLVENDWGTDHCGAFVRLPTGKMFAVRNNGVYGVLWSGSLLLLEKIALPYQVYPGSLVVSNDGYVITAGKNVSGGQLVTWTRRPYNSNTDITSTLPTSGGITRLILA